MVLVYDYHLTEEDLTEAKSALLKWVPQLGSKLRYYGWNHPTDRLLHIDDMISIAYYIKYVRLYQGFDFFVNSTKFLRNEIRAVLAGKYHECDYYKYLHHIITFTNIPDTMVMFHEGPLIIALLECERLTPKEILETKGKNVGIKECHNWHLLNSSSLKMAQTLLPLVSEETRKEFGQPLIKDIKFGYRCQYHLLANTSNNVWTGLLDVCRAYINPTLLYSRTSIHPHATLVTRSGYDCHLATICNLWGGELSPDDKTYTDITHDCPNCGCKHYNHKVQLRRMKTAICCRLYKKLANINSPRTNRETNKTLESTIQKRIEGETGGCHHKCWAGIIDVLTPTQIIEIKHWRHWKHALGQIIAYGDAMHEQHRQLRIHFFGEEPIEKQQIVDYIRTKGVVVTSELNPV